MAMFITNDVGMHPAQGCTNPEEILRKKCPSPRFPSGPLNLLMSKWMSNIGCRRGRGVKSERPVQKARCVAMGLWGFTISSWNVTTVDGCEILHHQKDG